MMIRISAPHFCAGAEAGHGVVERAAPIIAWMRGRHVDWVRAYCRRKGWELQILPASGSK